MAIWKRIKKIAGSKFIVILAMVSLWFIGSGSIQENSASADDYSLGAVYQRYLLGTKADYLAEEGSGESVMVIGSIGSGGVAGEFSYDDIVNAAEPSKNGDDAKKFASMMATYSTFGYFGNKVQGFESIGSYAVRGILGLVLMIPALTMDILQMIVPSLIGLIAKLNVISYLAAAITNLEVTSDLTEQLGISKDTITGLANALMTFAIIVILITVIMTVRKGTSNIDQRYASKLKGRLITLICLPLLIGGCASLLKQATDWVYSDDLNAGTGFSRYMVDVRSWAYNYNFAPSGNSAADGGITSTNKSSYVDLSFDPYTTKGGDRIAQINTNSSIVGDSTNLFKNSSLVLSYLTSASFTATDYINYKGTAASEYFYGRDEGDGETFGSYYRYAIDHKEQLADTKNAYNSSFKGKPKNAKDVQGSYLAAIDDYATKKGELIVSPQQAYRDRFIYGAKTSGDKLDKYYGTKPSMEMITGEVGTANGSAITDQSMFLVLSTIFGETGGRYYLDSPARGILQAKAKFDSNRSSYYVVSMVGNPLFTFFGLIAIPLLTLVVLAGVVVAVMSMGIVEMNVLPLSAYFKGLTLGDIEYAQALVVYTVGIGGTILMLIGIPSLTIKFLGVASSLIKLPAVLVGLTPGTPQSSLAYNGTTLIIQSAVSIIFGYLFVKSDSFREKFILLFTMPWSWAKASADRFLQSAGGVVVNKMRQNQQEALKKNPVHSTWKEYHQNNGLNSSTNRSDDVDSDNPNGLGGATGSGFLRQHLGGEIQALKKAYNNSNLANISQLKRKSGKFDVAETSLTENELDNELSEQTRSDSQKAKKDLVAMKQNPTKENIKNVKDSLENLRNQMINENADPGKIKRIDDAIENINSIHNGNENEEKLSESNKETPMNNEEASSSQTDESIKEKVNKSQNASKKISSINSVKEPKVANTIRPKNQIPQQAITDYVPEKSVGDTSSLKDVSDGEPKIDETGVATLSQPTKHYEVPTQNGSSLGKQKITKDRVNEENRNLEQSDIQDETSYAVEKHVSNKRTVKNNPTKTVTNVTKQINQQDQVREEIKKENNGNRQVFTENKTTEIVEKHIVDTDNKLHHVVNKQVENKFQVKHQDYNNLIRTLGKTTKVPEIDRTLNKLQSGGSNEDMKQAALELTKQIDQLKPKDRRNINSKKLVQILVNMIR